MFRALSSGATIDSTTVGPSFTGSMAYGANNPNAQFNSVSGAFVGLSFPNGPDTFYGWVRVDVDNAAGRFTIADWAYEDVAGTGITAVLYRSPAPLDSWQRVLWDLQRCVAEKATRSDLEFLVFHDDPVHFRRDHRVAALELP